MATDFSSWENQSDQVQEILDLPLGTKAHVIAVLLEIANGSCNRGLHAVVAADDTAFVEDRKNGAEYGEGVRPEVAMAVARVVRGR